MLNKLNDSANEDDDFAMFLSAIIPILYEEKEIPVKKNDTEEPKFEIHEMIKEGPENFIDDICIDTCKKLWSKNIYTKKTSVDDEKICIVLDKLSDENENRFIEKATKQNEKYICQDGNRMIVIYKKNKTERSIKKELKRSITFLKMQDVESGYFSKDRFLMNICDCEKVEGMKEYASKTNLEIKFDENKMEKTFEEYLKEKNFENLYVPEEERIYIDEYYLKGHKKYLETLK